MLEVKYDRYSLNKTVVIKNINEELFILLDIDKGKQYNLTEMEYQIISLILKNKALNEIVATLEIEYDAPSLQIKNDLIDYINELLDNGLIFPNTKAYDE